MRSIAYILWYINSHNEMFASMLLKWMKRMASASEFCCYALDCFVRVNVRYPAVPVGSPAFPLSIFPSFEYTFRKMHLRHEFCILGWRLRAHRSRFNISNINLTPNRIPLLFQIYSLQVANNSFLSSSARQLIKRINLSPYYTEL